MNSEPPNATTATARNTAVSTTGRAIKDETIVAAIWRHSSEIRADGSLPIDNATRNTPPMTGAASSSLNSESADAWISVTGQFAAARSAPRLIAGFSE